MRRWPSFMQHAIGRAVDGTVLETVIDGRFDGAGQRLSLLLVTQRRLLAGTHFAASLFHSHAHFRLFGRFGRDGRNRFFLLNDFVRLFRRKNAGPGDGRWLRNGQAFGRLWTDLDGRDQSPRGCLRRLDGRRNDGPRSRDRFQDDARLFDGRLFHGGEFFGQNGRFVELAGSDGFFQPPQQSVDGPFLITCRTCKLNEI